MPKKVQVQLSLAPVVKKKDLPLSPRQMTWVFEKTLRALSNEKKLQSAENKLGSALGRVALHVCSDAEMRGFQKNFRKLDRSTDVLSFPTLELSPKDLALMSCEELSLGDLVLSLPAIARGARRGRRSLGHEFLEVLIHGILHLLGFDHVLKNKGVSPNEAQKMIKIQKELFLKLKADIKLKTYVR